MMARRQKRTRQHSPRRDTYIGVIVLVLGVIAFYFSLTKTVPFGGPGGRLIGATFAEPNQIFPGQTPVRVNGVNVGTVDSVRTRNGGRTGRVELRITDSSLRLHADASAHLKFRTLLGANFVVELDPGSPSAPPLGPGGITLAHTTVQAEFDDVLRVFAGNIPAATRTDLRQLAAGVGGNRLGKLIDTLAPSLQSAPAGLGALRGSGPDDLGGLVRSASRTTAAIGGAQADLRRLIAGAQATLRATADEHVALGETLRDAPAALDATVAVSQAVEQTLPPLDRLVGALGPGARALAPSAAAATPAVGALQAVLGRARPLLASLRPAIGQLSAAAGPGIALVRALRPTVTRLNTQLIPWLQSPDSDLKRPVYELIGPGFASLGSVASEFDSKSYLIHFAPQPEAGSLTIAPCTLFSGAPTPAQLLQCNSLNNVLGALFGGGS